MKKLLTVLAASVGIAAFADTDTPPLSATSFESATYTAPFSVELDDDGADASAQSNKTWAGSDAEGDTNEIKAYGEGADALQRPTNRPDYYAGNDQAKFLKVDSTAGIARYVKKGGGAQGLDSNVYFDMDVQFTVSDSVQEPDETEGDKLLVWLYAPEAEGEAAVATNLVVTAATIGAERVPTAVNFVVAADGVNVQADTWYRLTVVSTTKEVEDAAVPHFQVYIDGKQAIPTGTMASNGAITALQGHDGLFGSLVQYDSGDTTTTTLTSVTFKGTGAVDDLVVTTVKPSFITEPTVEYNFDVDGTGCMTFGEAMNAVAANSTITLLKDYDLTTETTGAGVTISKGVTIALGGKKLSLANAEAALMTVSANVTLTGEGTIDNADGIAVIVSGGTLTIGTSASDSVTFVGIVACDTSSAYAIKYFSSETPALEVTDGENTLTWVAGTGDDAGYYVIAGGEAPQPEGRTINGGSGTEKDVIVTAKTVSAAMTKFGVSADKVTDAQILAYIVGGTTVGTGDNEKAVVPTPTISVNGTTVTVVCSGADSDYKVEYYLDYKTDLTAANWTEGTEPVAAGEAHTATLTDSAENVPQKFYRVRAVVSNKLSN